MTLNPTTLSLESQWISPPRLQWIMDVGHCTVSDWNKKKLIPHFRDDRIIRYAPENVLQFILSKTVQSKTLRPGLSPFVTQAPAIQTLTDETWKRIERMIADQVRAQQERQNAA